MFIHGALCILNLLHTYTVWLFPDIIKELSLTEQQRNLDILHLQAMMKVWQMKPPSLSQDRLCPAREEELEFVCRMLECVYLFAASSSQLWNAKIEKEVESQLTEHQGWIEEGEAATANSYQYVKTVDQAFPSSYTVENITSHRQELNEIKARREKDLQQRKTAWTDKQDSGLSNHETTHSSKNPSSGDLQYLTTKKTRPLSAKKQSHSPMKFDLRKSVFNEQASSSRPSSAERAEAARVKRNIRTAGFGKTSVTVINKDNKKDESAIKHDEDSEVRQKRLRLRLFQEGVCATVGPWVAYYQGPQIQVLYIKYIKFLWLKRK